MAAIDTVGVLHGSVVTAPRQTEAMHMAKIAHKARVPARGLVIDLDGHIAGSPAIEPSPKHAGVECKKKEHRAHRNSESSGRGSLLSVGGDGVVHETPHSNMVYADMEGTIHSAHVVVNPKSPAHVARRKEAHRKRSRTASETLCALPDGTVHVVDESPPALDGAGVVQGAGMIQPMSPARSYTHNARLKALHRSHRQLPASPVIAVDTLGHAHADDAKLWDFWLPPVDAAPAQVSCF